MHFSTPRDGNRYNRMSQNAEPSFPLQALRPVKIKLVASGQFMNELRRITERYLLEKQIASSEAVSIFRGTDLRVGRDGRGRADPRGRRRRNREWRQQFVETARALQVPRSSGPPQGARLRHHPRGRRVSRHRVSRRAPPSYQELREALRLVLFGEPGSLPAARPAAEIPSPPVVPARTETAARPRTGAGSCWGSACPWPPSCWWGSPSGWSS